MCKGLRRSHYAGPLLMVTKRRTMADRLQAFAYGADDVIADPFDPAKLVDCVEAIARRFQCAPTIKRWERCSRSETRS